MADNEIRQRKKKKKEISGEDHHEKRSKTAELTNKGINPLLILLLVCVVCTWGIAATLVFNLVDYRGIIGWAKNLKSLPTKEEPTPTRGDEEFLDENESILVYPILRKIKPFETKLVVDILMHPADVTEYTLAVRQARVNDDGFILRKTVSPVQDSIEIELNLYNDLEYELLISTNAQPEFNIQKFIANEIPEVLWNPEDDYSLIHEAENLLELAASRKKPNFDDAFKRINSLVYHNKQIGYLRFLQAKTLNFQAEQYRSNDKLKKACAKLDEVGRDESLLLAVRNKALDLAQERYGFLGQRGSQLAMSRLLVELNPTRKYVYLKAYGVSCLLNGLHNVATEAFTEMLEIDPSDGWANVHLGFALKADNKLEECIEPLRIGLASQEPGTKDSKFLYHYGDALTRLGRKKEADDMFEKAAQDKVFLSKFQRSTYNIDRLTGRPWWEKDDFNITVRNYIRKLEADWEIIRDEALSLMDENFNFPNFDRESEGLEKTGEWKQFNLWQRGMKDVKNCKLTPKTCHLLEPMTESVECRRGQIKFSVMKAGTIVWPHTGPTNCRLRCHLGLKVPNDWQNVNITVADETRHWSDGQVIIFDDSFEHSVMHHAESYRLILIFDIWHPEMTKNEKLTVTAI